MKFYRSAPVDRTEKKFRQFRWNFTGPRLSIRPKKSFVNFDEILQVRACRYDRKKVSSISMKFYRSAPVDRTEKKFRQFRWNFTGPRLSIGPKKSFVNFDEILQVRACRYDRKKVSSISMKFYRSAPVDRTEKKFRQFRWNFTGPRLSIGPKKSFVNFDEILQVRACR